MHRRVLAGDRLVATFLVGCVLFNYPLLAVFHRHVLFGGIPLVYGYIFLAWGLVIGLIAWAIERQVK